MHIPIRRLAAIAATLGLAVLAIVPMAQAAPAARVAAGTAATTQALALMPATIKAGFDIRIAFRRYALCAASDITPSTQTTMINGKQYTIGTGTCPIITGWTVYNKSLQGTSPTVSGRSTIWSSFGSPATFPQYSTDTGWTVGPAQGRTFTVGAGGNTAMANFWGFPCVVTTPQRINGTAYPMAVCAGPLMENIDNGPVAAGATAFTDASASATIPVGLGKTLQGQLAGMASFFMNPFPSS